MKKPSAIIRISAIVIVVLSLVTGWAINSRNTQKKWPSEQLRNGAALGMALSDYQRTHGSYPKRLGDLVAGGTLDATRFDDLKFRPTRRDAGEEWLYMVPGKPGDIAIVSPKSVFPWKGHSGYVVAARANGGAELMSGSKRHSLPGWAQK